MLNKITHSFFRWWPWKTNHDQHHKNSPWRNKCHALLFCQRCFMWGRCYKCKARFRVYKCTYQSLVAVCLYTSWTGLRLIIMSNYKCITFFFSFLFFFLSFFSAPSPSALLKSWGKPWFYVSFRKTCCFKTWSYTDKFSRRLVSGSGSAQNLIFHLNIVTKLELFLFDLYEHCYRIKKNRTVLGKVFLAWRHEHWIDEQWETYK